jgi:hypothetical protein
MYIFAEILYKYAKIQKAPRNRKDYYRGTDHFPADSSEKAENKGGGLHTGNAVA